MRRTEKEITGREEIESILRRAEICRIGLCDGARPYIVPMNFAYRENSIYLHAAHEGKKLDLIRANDSVCVEVEADTELVRGATACDWGMRFRCVIGLGTASIIDDPAAKKQALSIIMEKYSGTAEQAFRDESLERTTAIRIDLHHLTGKQSGW